MFLIRLIKYFLLHIIFILGIYQVNAADSTVYVSSPYKTEYNPWFKLTKFQRGFSSDSLSRLLDELEEKPRAIWTRLDSLNFARTSLQTGNIKLSEYYFRSLKINFETENKYWWDEMILYLLNRNYDAGIESIHQNSPGIVKYSKIYFLDQFLIAYKAQEKDEKWYKNNAVLKLDIDSSLFNESKRSERFNSKIIKPLQNLDFVLKKLIHHIHQEAPILAVACTEMGSFLEAHLSLTQAYIAYNLGRHYNKWDKEILNKIKAIKVKLSKKRYKIPIFRRYFPRTELWRFDYEVMKEKIYPQQLDTIPKVAPTLMLPKEENKLAIVDELIIIAGLGFIFLMVLLFVKTKK